MATPYVTAAAALVAARFPDKDATQIKNHLMNKAKKLAAMNNPKDESYGKGLLNLKNALK